MIRPSSEGIMDVDVSEWWQPFERRAGGFASALPRLPLTLFVVGVFYLISRGVRASVRR